MPDSLQIPVLKLALSLQKDIRASEELDINLYIENNQIKGKKIQKKLKIVKTLDK